MIITLHASQFMVGRFGQFGLLPLEVKKNFTGGVPGCELKKKNVVQRFNSTSPHILSYALICTLTYWMHACI